MDQFERHDPYPSFLTSTTYSADHPRPAPPTPADDRPALSSDHHQVASLMRGAKRKRLAKACDACHKSKRRCDGTAPCSNCYFATKQCTYTDASGRPVPAPHRFDPARANLLGPPPVDSGRTLPFTPSQPQPPANGSDPPRFASNHRILTAPPGQQPTSDSSDDDRRNGNGRKRFRNERGIAISPDDLVIDGPLMTTLDRPRAVELDHGLMRELTNLFFAHCHPARAIIHKPTFTSNLSHSKVPKYLLHAVCALAAPLSKQPRIRTNPTRFAGRPFAQEALSLMFDGAGRLKCEPNLATAQALCLLQMHDIVTKEKNVCWTSRYHDLALRIVEALGVHSPEHPTLTPVPSPEFISVSMEREAIRRIFWYIHLLDLKASIYFKKPITFTEAELRLRLPVDETSFELGVHSTLPEYLYLPAVRTQNASEFGHLVRIITIYAKMETTLDELNVPYQDPDNMANVSKALFEVEQHMENWARTLPDHLRFSEQSLQIQESMFETSSNTGAWCWCMLHIYHASCALALNCARQRNQRDPVVEPQWALNMIESILQMIGDRAKNSLLLGAALWSLIKYCKRDDPQIRAWCSNYEEFFGTRMVELVNDWRPHPSPPPRHQFSVPGQTAVQASPNSHAQQPPRPPHRLSDARNPGIVNIPNQNARLPLAHHGDTSNNHRRSQSPRATSSYLHSRFSDEEQSIDSATRLPPPHALSDSRDSHPGPTLPPPSTISIASLALHASGSNEPKRSIKSEQDGNNLRGNEPPSGEGPGIRNGRGSQDRSPTLESLPSSSSGSGPSRNHSSGENSQSLPSLKASGLLDWSHGARIGERQGHGPNGPQQRTSPRRSPRPILYHNIDDNRTTIPPLSLPVGMKWLANESR